MKTRKIIPIASSRIALLWECERWDVVLSGILKLDNEKLCYFERVHHPAEAEEGRISPGEMEYNRYDVFELLPDQAQREIETHQDFLRYVGSHTDFTDNRQKPLDEKEHLVRPVNEHKKFYDKHPKIGQEEYTENEYLGSFYMDNDGIIDG